MLYSSVPIKNFVVVSEDEDVEDAATIDFHVACVLLHKLREDFPDKEWSLVAEIEA